MNNILKLVTVVILVASIGSFSACKKDFDNPPGPADPNIVANTTIQALKALHTTSGAYDLITTDIIISGIVVANDKSGNFYKQLFIQDSTGAMQLKLEAYSLYGSYPVGRKVWVKCKGLTLSDENSNMVLGVKAFISGLPSIENVPGNDVGQHLIGGSIGNPVVPIPVTLNDLQTSMNNRYINALVKLEGYEFVNADTAKTYSDTSAYKATQNRNITPGCNAPLTSQVIVRNSAYANFAALPLPNGNGSITAIYTIFKSSPTSTNVTKQLLIRDTADIQFNNQRCGGIIPPSGNVLLSEDFETQTANTTFPYVPITISGWNNLPETGGRFWDAKIFSGNKYAYLSAFGSALPSVKTWLVTKGVNLNATTTETLTFDTKQDFILTAVPGGTNVESALKLLVSTDYTGTGNPWTTGTWTDITGQATLSPGSTTSNFPTNYTSSGNISLSAYTGTIYVAFRYEGADNTGTATDKTSAWELDNVRITGN